MGKFSFRFCALLLLALPFPQLLAQSFEAASFNLCIWCRREEARFGALVEALQKREDLRPVRVLFIQEARQERRASSAARLAAKLGWNSYFQKRVSDEEGLAFLYAPEVKILARDALQIQAKHSARDYSRMALSLQIELAEKPVRLINLHLAHAPDMAETRKAQLREVIIWIWELEKKHPSSAVLIAGDFNTGPTQSYYAREFELLEKRKRAYLRVPSTGADFSWQSEDGETRELVDHFFISAALLDSAKAQILTFPIEEGISDHALLRLSVELPN